MGLSIREIIATYNPDAHLSEASTPPSSWYTDPRILELEQKTVLSQSWQFVGRTDQLGDPGNYITCDVAGEPIVVVVGNDNVPRGFFNVCRHHAAAVMTQSEGRAENLRCPYHGWTYDLEGALVAYAGIRRGLPISTAPRTGLFQFKLRSGRTGCS